MPAHQLCEGCRRASGTFVSHTVDPRFGSALDRLHKRLQVPCGHVHKDFKCLQVQPFMHLHEDLKCLQAQSCMQLHKREAQM